MITKYNYSITKNYQLVIRKQAKKKLQSLAKNIRLKLAENISFLGKNPEDKRLDVKKLKNSEYFRLRVGDWRVIFNRDDQIKIISIEKIDIRGGVYK